MTSYQHLPEIQEWKERELEEGNKLIEVLKNKNLDLRGKVIINFLTKGIDKYIQNSRK